MQGLARKDEPIKQIRNLQDQDALGDVIENTAAQLVCGGEEVMANLPPAGAFYKG